MGKLAKILCLVCLMTLSACGPSPPAGLFQLLPPDFTAASYFDLKYTRENPDLNLLDQADQYYCSTRASHESVDEALAVVSPATISEDFAITAVHICRGNFDQETILEQDGVSVISTEDYQGFELSILTFGSGSEMASVFLDETTWVIGYNEAGVKAFLDTANSSEPSPYTDLGAALTDAFFAMMLAYCDYEGCELRGISIEKGSEETASTVQFFQFENAELAAEALPMIKEQYVDGGMMNMVGSVSIEGDQVKQEGRFIRFEGTLPVEDLPRMFE